MTPSDPPAVVVECVKHTSGADGKSCAVPVVPVKGAVHAGHRRQGGDVMGQQ